MSARDLRSSIVKHYMAPSDIIKKNDRAGVAGPKPAFNVSYHGLAKIFEMLRCMQTGARALCKPALALVLVPSVLQMLVLSPCAWFAHRASSDLRDRGEEPPHLHHHAALFLVTRSSA